MNKYFYFMHTQQGTEVSFCHIKVITISEIAQIPIHEFQNTNTFFFSVWNLNGPLQCIFLGGYHVTVAMKELIYNSHYRKVSSMSTFRN